MASGGRWRWTSRYDTYYLPIVAHYYHTRYRLALHSVHHHSADQPIAPTQLTAYSACLVPSHPNIHPFHNHVGDAALPNSQRSLVRQSRALATPCCSPAIQLNTT